MSSKYNNIDDLFRDKFNSFEPEPPAHIWDNIEESINGANGKPFTNGGIAGLTSVIILAGLFTFLNITGFQKTEEAIGDIENTVSVSENLLAVHQSIEASYPQIEENIFVEENLSQKENPNLIIESLTEEAEITELVAGYNNREVITDQNSIVAKIENFDQTEPQNSDLIENEPDPDRDLLALAADADDLGLIKSEVIHSANKEKPGNISESTIRMTTIAEAATPAEPGEPGIRSDYGRRNTLQFGLHFTPELTYYPEDDKYSNRSYSFDLSAAYKFSGYLLQSGLGLSWVKDDGDYAIDYEKYEYMGSYQDVYDITFDTVGGDIVPTYHTQEVEVFDSIQHLSVSPTKNTYTYLQIPVLFGYGDEVGRFSWFVKGGPNLSIMIYENKPEMDMPGSDINILSIDNKMPTRIRTNWQLLFSAGASYKLSNNLSLSVEPMLRYYIKSAYDRNNMQTKHPYSIGLRTGLLINF